MSKPIATCVLGVGLSGLTFHVPFILALKDSFTLHSVLERSPTQEGGSVKRRFGESVKIHRSFEAVIADPEIELVIIGTPNDTHYDFAKASLLAGKHVLVDKPVTPTSEQARELYRIAQSKGLVLYAYQNRRWDSDFLALKKLLSLPETDTRSLGKIVEFESHFDRYRPGLKGSWKDEARPAAGITYDLGAHLIDQSLVLFGHPDNITAFIQNLRGLGSPEVDDCFTIYLHYQRCPSRPYPITVTLRAHCLSARTSQLRYMVRGTRGSYMKYGVDIQEDQLKAIPTPESILVDQHGKEPESLWGSLDIVQGDGVTLNKTIWPSEEAGCYASLFRNLAAAIREGAELLVPWHDAQSVIQLIELAHQSAKEGKTVNVPQFIPQHSHFMTHNVKTSPVVVGIGFGSPRDDNDIGILPIPGFHVVVSSFHSMSIVQLRIELPTYAHSFSIQVPDACTILEVKEEISRICPGRPRVDGQKLIWRGRFLADNEKVETIWKSPSEPRIVHLSVHPSAWISGPPTVQSTNILPTGLSSQPTPTITIPSSQPLPMPVPPSPTLTAKRLPFVFARHVEAITVLMEGRANPAGVNAMPDLREDAIKLLELNGWSWPSVLDEPYPELIPGGLKYEQVTIEGTPYLSLANEGAQPTLGQAQALRVLSYTFSILTKELRQEVQSNNSYPPAQTIPDRQTVPNIPHINDLLQQMGLPPLRNAHNVEAVLNQEQQRAPNLLPDVPIRPLLAPLFLLILRTSLLLYFVAPTRKPIFGILIIAWMLYEIWQPIRNNLLRQLQQDEQDAGRNGARAPAAPAQAAAQANAPEFNNLPAQRGPQARGLVEMLGNMNIEAEQQVMELATREDSREPNMGHKIVTFLSLMLTTLHPAIWNQRRAALRSREGTIRTEVNMRSTERRTDLEGDEAFRAEERAEQARQALRERHVRRPLWIQRYIERVVNAEWVDDAD